MTKSNPLAAAIEAIELQECEARVAHNKKWEAELIQGKAVLEAAGKCQAMLSSDGSCKRVVHLSDLMALEEALLAALPANTEDSDD